MKNLFLIAVIVLGFSAASFGQDEATITGASASATILKVLKIEKGVTELNFGVLTANPENATTVILAADGGLSGTATRYEGIGAAATTAEFKIEGTPDASFVLSLPATISLNNALVGGAAMTITNLVTDLAGATDRTDNLDETSGLKTFNVGGTLNVGINQKAGTYTGVYDVTVNYN